MRTWKLIQFQVKYKKNIKITRLEPETSIFLLFAIESWDKYWWISNIFWIVIVKQDICPSLRITCKSCNNDANLCKDNNNYFGWFPRWWGNLDSILIYNLIRKSTKPSCKIQAKFEKEDWASHYSVLQVFHKNLIFGSFCNIHTSVFLHIIVQ